MADNVGTLKTNVIANASGFVSGMAQATASAIGSSAKIKAAMGALSGMGGTMGLGGAMSGLGSLMSPGMMGSGAVSGIYSTMQAMASSAKELQRNAAQAGVGVEQYQELRRAAERSGLSVETVTAGLGRMQRSVYEANSGNKNLSATFSKLGLSTEKLMRMDAGQQMEAVAAGLSKISNVTERRGLEAEIFGRGGAKMDPMLMQMGSGGGMGQFKKWFDLNAVEAQSLAEQKNMWGKELPSVAAKVWGAGVTGFKAIGTYLGSGGQVSFERALQDMETEAAMREAKNKRTGAGAGEDNNLHALGGLAMAGSQAAYQSSVAWQFGMEEKKVNLLQQIAHNTGEGGIDPPV